MMPQVECPRCGQPMRAAIAKTAIWREERLFVVEDIPAQVCDACKEQFYDEETAEALRRLTEEGFASLEPQREILVPIFSIEAKIRRPRSSEDDVYADY